MITTAIPEVETEFAASEIVIGGRKAWVYQRMIQGVRGGNYYVKGYVPGGKEFFRSTGLSTKGMALDAARKLWRAALEGRLDALDATRIRKTKPMATIGELVQAHALAEKRGELGLKGDTAKAYRACLERVVAWARGLHDRPDGGQRERIHTKAVAKVSAAALDDPQFVTDFFRHYVAPAGADILAQDERVRSAHSMMRNARAMFSPGALGVYRGLTVPTLESFMTAKLQRKAEPVEHAMLTDDAVREMALFARGVVRNGRDLPISAPDLRETNPSLYAVHLLFRHCAMRNDEIAEARVEWIEKLPAPRKIWLPDGQVREIVAVLAIRRRAYWKPKKSAGDVPLSADVLAELQPFLDGRDGLEHLVPAVTKTERWELIYRAHSDFMRPWTGEHQKTSYELRRWGATKIARLHQSAEMAERFLRHAKKTVAEKHYLTEQPLPAPITLADVGL